MLPRLFHANSLKTKISHAGMVLSHAIFSHWIGSFERSLVPLIEGRCAQSGLFIHDFSPLNGIQR